jgi:hypothetical protein
LNKNKKQAINGLAVLFKLYIERKGWNNVKLFLFIEVNMLLNFLSMDQRLEKFDKNIDNKKRSKYI